MLSIGVPIGPPQESSVTLNFRNKPPVKILDHLFVITPKQDF